MSCLLYVYLYEGEAETQRIIEDILCTVVFD